MARQITKKKAVVFSFKAPEAKSVMVAGDFTNWAHEAIPLEKQPNGTWQVTVPLASRPIRKRKRGGQGDDVHSS